MHWLHDVADVGQRPSGADASATSIGSDVPQAVTRNAVARNAGSRVGRSDE